MNKLGFVLGMKFKVVSTTLMYFGDFVILGQIYRSFYKCYFLFIMVVLMIKYKLILLMVVSVIFVVGLVAIKLLIKN